MCSPVFSAREKPPLLLRLLTALKAAGWVSSRMSSGKLGIDGQILQRGDVEMVEINRGSIFCSCLKLSFVQALADMAKQNLDYLFVESSGLGRSPPTTRRSTRLANWAEISMISRGPFV